MIKLNIDPEAAAFIQEEGGHAIIFAGKTTGCCTIGSLLEPMVELGKPRRPLEEYEVTEVGGATLYLDRTLESVEQTFRLHVTRFLKWKSLSVSYEGG